jgi:predicted nucleic acid-binding protein
MVLLDTNVLSALMIQPADPAVVVWLDRQARESIWTTSITLLEIHFGLNIMAGGRRRKARLAAFRRLVDEVLEDRIANFDRSAAEASAALMARRKAAGQPVDLRDTMIAGIAQARKASLATRNVKHFVNADIKITNPWQP